MRGAGQDGKEANAIMMKFPRMLYRSVLLLIYLPASYLYEVLTLLFRPDLRMAANRLGRILCRILGIRLIVEGEAPREFGGLIVSNHWGYLDIVTHSAVFRTLRFAAKSDIRRWPVLGWYLRIHRPIWIDRSNRQKAKEVADRIADTMRGGRSLLVYPEGTSSDGTAILPFKSTAFDPVIREGFPVLPVLTYERFEDVFSLLAQRPTPLALYFFSSDKERIRQVQERVLAETGVRLEPEVRIIH